jgi:hypothetical protein
LVLELLGGGDPEHCRAERFRCEGCCKHPVPNEWRFNPAFASLLYGVTGRLLQGRSGGEALRKVAAPLRDRAEANLLRIELQRPGDAGAGVAYAGPCFYLGKRSVRQASGRGDAVDGSPEWHWCDHEDHGEVTLDQCKRCPDYEPRLSAGGVRTWSVGVTTAPRKKPTLGLTVESLVRAGWPQVHLFAEPATRIPAVAKQQTICRRSRTMGAWPNFLLSLTELVLAEPHADAYLMVQDDVQLAQGLRGYLEAELWPGRRLGVVSLYTASHHDRGDLAGFYAADHGWGVWGAQALVFPNAGARALLRDPAVVNHRHRGPGDGRCNVDSVVGRWCRQAGLAYYMHTPSLAQHIGDTSTLWRQATAAGRRCATSFPGEEVEIGEFMSGLRERRDAGA